MKLDKYTCEGQMNIFDFIKEPEPVKEDLLPCDTCGHDIKGCCDYDYIANHDYCVLGSKWIPKAPEPVPDLSERVGEWVEEHGDRVMFEDIKEGHYYIADYSTVSHEWYKIVFVKWIKDDSVGYVDAPKGVKGKWSWGNSYSALTRKQYINEPQTCGGKWYMLPSEGPDAAADQEIKETTEHTKLVRKNEYEPWQCKKCGARCPQRIIYGQWPYQGIRTPKRCPGCNRIVDLPEEVKETAERTNNHCPGLKSRCNRTEIWEKAKAAGDCKRTCCYKCKQDCEAKKDLICRYTYNVCSHSGHTCDKENRWEIADSWGEVICPHVCCRQCNVKDCDIRCRGSEEPKTAAGEPETEVKESPRAADPEPRQLKNEQSNICQYSLHTCNKTNLWEIAETLDGIKCPKSCCRICSVKNCGARCNGSEEPKRQQDTTDEYLKEHPTCFYVFGHYLDKADGWHKVPEELPAFATWQKVDVVVFGKKTGTPWMECNKWEAKDWTFRTIEESKHTESIEVLAWKLSDQEGG